MADFAFQAPKSDSEFRRRATDITPVAAQAMIKSLKRRRDDAIKPLNEEIEFYERVLREKSGSV